MNKRSSLGALALDLTRVSLGYKRGSTKMVTIFLAEAKKRFEEVRNDEATPEVRQALQKLEMLFSRNEIKEIAENAPEFSTLFQNAALQS